MSTSGTSSQPGRLSGDWMMPATGSSGPPQAMPTARTSAQDTPAAATASRPSSRWRGIIPSGPSSRRLGATFTDRTRPSARTTPAASFVPPTSRPRTRSSGSHCAGGLAFRPVMSVLLRNRSHKLLCVPYESVLQPRRYVVVPAARSPDASPKPVRRLVTGGTVGGGSGMAQRSLPISLLTVVAVLAVACGGGNQTAAPSAGGATPGASAPAGSAPAGSAGAPAVSGDLQ